MIKSGKRKLRPRVEQIEDRCLLSTAVVDITNQSSFNITFDFRWSPSNRWTPITEAPGQGVEIYTSNSSTLKPQVRYDTTTSSRSETTVTLANGFGVSPGRGVPPASTGTPYTFVNTNTGVDLIHSGSSPTPTPTPTPAPSPTPTPAPTPTPTPAPSPTPTPAPTPTPTPAPSPTPTPTPLPNTSATTSSNWSGYAAESSLSSPQADSVTAVSGSWTVPAVTGSSRGTTDSSVWVGIDGYSDSTVEQVGTEEDVVNGVPEYAAWWEMYSSGKGQPEQVITNMTIEPGDSISASVTYIATGAHAGDFLLSIVDNSRANDSFSAYESSSQLQSPLAERSSAEWIVEAPSVGGGISSLANFGAVTFTNASATINGVTGPINDPAWQSQAINIASGRTTDDTTSVLTDSGTSFVESFGSSLAGAEVQGGRNQATSMQLGASIGTNPTSNKKARGTVAVTPAPSGPSAIWGFPSSIRQAKKSTKGFPTDSLLST
jgi:Peptidase A4 family